MTDEEQKSVDRHVDYMMYEAFCGGLQCANVQLPDKAEMIDMYFRWLARWKTEQAAQDAEKARAAANFKKMTELVGG